MPQICSVSDMKVYQFFYETVQENETNITDFIQAEVTKIIILPHCERQEKKT